VESASFLDRFLSNVEGIYTAIEDRIATAQVLFDLRSAPTETLDWLASWFGAVLDPSWDDARRRLFLRHIIDFYQYRGTLQGVRAALRIAFESCPSDSIFDPATQNTHGTVRIVEKFRMRGAPSQWSPSQGAAALHQLYSTALGRPTQYPVQSPADAAEGPVWTAFSQKALGFVPDVSSSNLTAWTLFLVRRYLVVDNLNTAWHSSFDSIQSVALPAVLPTLIAPLTDWFDFQRIVLPMQASAHRFRVSIPVPAGSESDPLAQQRLMQLAQRIIDLEKPAHTLYELNFFHAIFQLGSARLGEDSILDFGSRAPKLMPPAVLGQSFIASSYIAPGAPQDAADRRILGRDILKRGNTPRSTGASQ
jgi:phage tail-like protein